MKKLVGAHVRALAVAAMAAALLLGQRAGAHAGWSGYDVIQTEDVDPDTFINTPYIEGGVYLQWAAPQYSEPENGAG